MRARGILLTVLIALFALFAAVNWTTLTTPLPVNLLILRIEVPVGLVLVGLTVALALVFFAGALFDRASQLSEVRHLEKQLEKTRARLDAKQADQIETVRESLQAWGASLEKRIDERVGAAEQRIGEVVAASDERSAERMQALERRVATVRNELAADVGEAEDAILRLLGPRQDALPDEVP